MNKYAIEYGFVFLSGNRSDRYKTYNPVEANSKYDAVAKLSNDIGAERAQVEIEIFSVEEL